MQSIVSNKLYGLTEWCILDYLSRQYIFLYWDNQINWRWAISLKKRLSLKIIFIIDI